MIDVKTDGRICTITINRPDKANSLSTEMLQALLDAVNAAGDTAHVLILTGVGKVFSAGADLDEVQNGLATDEVWENLSGAITDLPCLTIAALNGTLAGGAFGMVLACDIRISVASAGFFYPVMKLGFLPQPSDPRRLADIIGPARAKLVLMGGQKLTADQALEFGLIDRVVKSAELLSVAAEIGHDAAQADKQHLIGIKSLFGAT